MHILQSLKNPKLSRNLLIQDIFFVNILKDFGPNDSMKISLHEIEYEIDVFIILCPNEVL